MQRLYRFPRRADAVNPGGRLYVPGRVAKHVPDEAWFVCELTDEGILYRLVDPVVPPVDQPAWANRLREGS